MKTAIIYLFVLLVTCSVALAQEDPKFQTGKQQKTFQDFTGNWKIIYNGFDLAHNLNSSITGKANISTEFKGSYLNMVFDLSTKDSDLKMIWTFAYDCISNKYVLYSKNSAMTYPYYGTGDYNADAKSFSFLTNAHDEHGNRFKVVLKWEREDKFSLLLYNFTIKNAETLVQQYTLIKLD